MEDIKVISYKSKKETNEYRTLFQEAFKYVQNLLVEYKVYYRLIGSAKRNLVLEKPNKGFDFDYQIIFYDTLVGRTSDELIKIKKDFRDAFDNYYVPLGYKYGEDSRAAITIKKLNEDKIHHSYDITILCPSKDNDKKIYIMRYEDQEKLIMSLNEMKKSVIFNDKYIKIKGSDKWAELRDLYKKKQEKWNGEKKSFSILMETVNEIIIDD